MIINGNPYPQRRKIPVRVGDFAAKTHHKVVSSVASAVTPLTPLRNTADPTHRKIPSRSHARVTTCRVGTLAILSRGRSRVSGGVGA